jgi:hypothetical protein
MRRGLIRPLYGGTRMDIAGADMWAAATRLGAR